MKTNLINSNAYLVFFIKSTIICLSFGFIYYKVLITGDFSMFQSSVRDVFYSGSLLLLIIPVLILFILNMGTEAFKWKMVMQKLQKISFFEACKAVFSGVTVGLFTPNRIGDYGGRIIYLEKDKRTDAVVSAIAGSLSQLFITIVCGIIGVIGYFRYYNPVSTGNYYWLLLLIIPLCFFLFLNIQKVPDLFHGKASRYLKAFALFNKKELVNLVLLSLLRYLIFFLQFYILLIIFNIGLRLSEAMFLLPVIFLAISIIPSFALVEWGVRGSASVYFIGSVSENSTGILAAAMALWLINIALPALFGAFFIAKHKLS